MPKKNPKPSQGELKQVVDFLFEAGMLAKTPRSGFHFLGSGDQSIAEHITRVMYVGFSLCQISEKPVDVGKVMQMCAFHDFAEARTSDLNYVHQKYVYADEEKAVKDLVKAVPFGQAIWEILGEYRSRKSHESLLAKDADQLEWILSLKEEWDIGNSRAKTWIPSAIKRLKTKEARSLAKIAIQTSSDNWWFANKSDSWWVSRDKKTKQKRF